MRGRVGFGCRSPWNTVDLRLVSHAQPHKLSVTRRLAFVSAFISAFATLRPASFHVDRTDAPGRGPSAVSLAVTTIKSPAVRAQRSDADLIAD
jgi:hypothetical protein